jgi:hypothetical protein
MSIRFLRPPLRQRRNVDSCLAAGSVGRLQTGNIFRVSGNEKWKKHSELKTGLYKTGEARATRGNKQAAIILLCRYQGLGELPRNLTVVMRSRSWNEREVDEGRDGC